MLTARSDHKPENKERGDRPEAHSQLRQGFNDITSIGLNAMSFASPRCKQSMKVGCHRRRATNRQ